MHTIMIAIDGSAGSKAVVREGLALAHQMGADVTFVAVRPTPLPVFGDPFYQRKVSEDLAQLRPAIVAAVREADELDVVAEYEILEGNPVEEIVRLARLRDADMIVIGSRGRGAVTSAVLGSVSQGVIHAADRPVLVVTPRVEARASAAA